MVIPIGLVRANKAGEGKYNESPVDQGRGERVMFEDFI
jgi:hypothetical protein